MTDSVTVLLQLKALSYPQSAQINQAKIYPQTCPVKFFVEEERSEFNRGNPTPAMRDRKARRAGADPFELSAMSWRQRRFDRICHRVQVGCN